MNHPVKWPSRFPSGDQMHAHVTAELVPVDSAEPWRTVTFTTFAGAWAIRLVDELSAALSAPLLWIGWRDENEEPPRTVTTPAIGSSFEVEELASRMNSSLTAMMARAKNMSRHLVVASGPKTFIVNLSFKMTHGESATENVDTVKAETPKQNRRIRDEF